MSGAHGTSPPQPWVGDERVAALLERCASSAGQRGGHAARVALLSRAAVLTPDPEHAARRRVAAADTALASNAPHQAITLIALATPQLKDAASLAMAARLEGCAKVRLGQCAEAAATLLAAAEVLLDADPELGRQTLLEAVEAAFLAGTLNRSTPDLERVLATAHPSPTSDPAVGAVLDAVAAYVSLGYAAAVPALRSSVEVMRDGAIPAEQRLRWSILAGGLARALWDWEAHRDIVNRLADISRERAALSWLGAALQAHSAAEQWAGRLGCSGGVHPPGGGYHPRGWGTPAPSRDRRHRPARQARPRGRDQEQGQPHHPRRLGSRPRGRDEQRPPGPPGPRPRPRPLRRRAPACPRRLRAGHHHARQRGAPRHGRGSRPRGRLGSSRTARWPGWRSEPRPPRLPGRWD